MASSTRHPDRQRTSRARARVTMRILTGACVMTALALGAAQLSSNGVSTFFDRAPGVGFTPDDTPSADGPPGRPGLGPPATTRPASPDAVIDDVPRPGAPSDAWSDPPDASLPDASTAPAEVAPSPRPRPGPRPEHPPRPGPRPPRGPRQGR